MDGRAGKSLEGSIPVRDRRASKYLHGNVTRLIYKDSQLPPRHGFVHNPCLVKPEAGCPAPVVRNTVPPAVAAQLQRALDISTHLPSKDFLLHITHYLMADSDFIEDPVFRAKVLREYPHDFVCHNWILTVLEIDPKINLETTSEWNATHAQICEQTGCRTVLWSRDLEQSHRVLVLGTFSL